MANFTTPENPLYTDEIRKLETTDKGHASIFNALLEKLFHNILFLRKKIDTSKEDALTEAYQQSTGYTNQKVADLINGAPSTLDTLGEIATAMQDNVDVVAALNAAIGTKAAAAELDSHTGNTTIHTTESERTKWNKITAITQSVTAIQVVSALPTDAESHPNTLYIVVE